MTGGPQGDPVTAPITAEAAWAEFSAPLRAFIARRVPHGVDPDDVLQDTFLRIVRHLPTIGEVDRLDAWIFRVARTALADALRTSHRRDGRTEDLQPESLPDDSGKEDPAAVAELTPCLRPLVAQLAEPYRSALQLTVVEGLTQQEAATRAGISFSGMKSRVQRAREQVKGLLLRCCEVDLDARGSVVDYSVRDTSVCGDLTTGNNTDGCGAPTCATPDAPRSD